MSITPMTCTEPLMPCDRCGEAILRTEPYFLVVDGARVDACCEDCHDRIWEQCQESN